MLNPYESDISALIISDANIDVLLIKLLVTTVPSFLQRGTKKGEEGRETEDRTNTLCDSLALRESTMRDEHMLQSAQYGPAKSRAARRQ